MSWGSNPLERKIGRELVFFFIFFENQANYLKLEKSFKNRGNFFNVSLEPESTIMRKKIENHQTLRSTKYLVQEHTFLCKYMILLRT
jgi:hypothetical protein